jgi:protein-tyrosine kinase
MASRPHSPVLKTTDAETGAEIASGPGAPRDRSRAIGAILVDAGRLTAADAEEIQVHAGKAGLRFGDAAVELNKARPEDIEFALSRQFNYTVLPQEFEGNIDPAVIAAYNPQCSVVEALRSIRSRLLLGWLVGAERNVLAVTSPERREGRSWFAANLATVFAQAGKRTLLIDADMRQPSQDRLFRLKNDVGLTALLTGRAGKEIAYRIHPRLRLFVVTAGLPCPNPQELLVRDVFDFVLDRFSQQYDLVVLDTPAATETADAEVLAARAGAAVLLVRQNFTRQAQLLQAMDCLKRSGTKVIGSVVNEY